MAWGSRSGLCALLTADKADSTGPRRSRRLALCTTQKRSTGCGRYLFRQQDRMRIPEKVLLLRMSMIRFEAPDQSTGRVPLSALLDTSSSFSEGMLARAAQPDRIKLAATFVGLAGADAAFAPHRLYLAQTAANFTLHASRPDEAPVLGAVAHQEAMCPLSGCLQAPETPDSP